MSRDFQEDSVLLSYEELCAYSLLAFLHMHTYPCAVHSHWLRLNTAPSAPLHVCYVESVTAFSGQVCNFLACFVVTNFSLWPVLDCSWTNEGLFYLICQLIWFRTVLVQQKLNGWAHPIWPSKSSKIDWSPLPTGRCFLFPILPLPSSRTPASMFSSWWLTHTLSACSPRKTLIFGRQYWRVMYDDTTPATAQTASATTSRHGRGCRC